MSQGDETRNLKDYLLSEHPKVEPINPKDEKQSDIDIVHKPNPKKNPETPKNDANNEYEYSDDDNEDDRNW